jgi:hypothetical protein
MQALYIKVNKTQASVRTIMNPLQAALNCTQDRQILSTTHVLGTLQILESSDFSSAILLSL